MKPLRRLLLVLAAFSLASPAAADTPDDLKTLLPKPLAGWNQSAAEAAKLRNGFRAVGQYRAASGGAVIDVVYRIGASSDTEREKKLLAAPEDAKKANAEVVEIAGRKWLLRTAKSAGGTTHTITTVLDNDLLITVSGFRDDGKAHEAYAAAIDAAGLAKLK